MQLGLSAPEHKMMVDARRLKLLDGLSDLVLTYEDKEGDWMLVGDVPWGYVSFIQHPYGYLMQRVIILS